MASSLASPIEVSDRADFYQSHLNRVSRSFAFCIARLEGSLREQVALGYLICRVLDTVEDASWSDFSAQEVAFLKFDQFMLRRPEEAEVSAWVESFPPGLPEGEVLLLKDAFQIFSDFHALGSTPKEALLKPIQSMSAGMRHFMERKAKQGGRLRLKGLADVNRYCFFVAGVVGEMLTRLVQGTVPSPAALSDGVRFGLFLQKVNILKDQSGDEKEGRFLVPSRNIVRASLRSDGEAAFRYLLNIPDRAVAFRLFCAWSFFLGLASLPWIEKSFQDQPAQANQPPVKISREETAALLAVVEEQIENPQGLKALFEQLKSRLQESSEVSSEERFEDASQLLALYNGELGQEDLLKIFAAKA